MIKEGLLYIALIAVPVIIFVEFLCRVDDKARKEKKAANERVKREISRRGHPSHGEDR